MVHIELPEESVYGAELQEMKNIDFLGYDLEHETVKMIALGQMDPVSKELFIVSEEDNRVVERVCGRRQPTHNFKTGAKASKGKKQMNMFEMQQPKTSFK